MFTYGTLYFGLGIDVIGIAFYISLLIWLGSYSPLWASNKSRNK